MTKIIKEACIDSLEMAKYYIDKKEEIDRFETCSDLAQGGLTPTVELFNFINNQENPINQIVMIRNKNVFHIDDLNDIEIMKKQIQELGKNGAKNFIFGYLDQENNIDKKTCNQLIEEVKKIPNSTYSFHMAIDLTSNYEKSMQTLIQMGFVRVLTKGGQGSAVDNIDKLKQINQEFGNQIEILVGGKVTKDNYLQIHSETKLIQFHGTKIA